jgi:Trk-type K+ transport system membrane component
MAKRENNKSTFLKKLRHHVWVWGNAIARFLNRGMVIISRISQILMVITVIAALLCLVALVIRTGYDHTPVEIRQIHSMIRITQGIFIVNVLFNLVLNLRNTIRNTRLIKWIVDISVLLTLLPWIYPYPSDPWIPWLESLLYSNKFLYTVLACYSIVAICYAVFKLIGRRTNPSLLMSGSFLVFIIIGSFLLMLPKCTYGSISYIDSLFVSTSAVSITGLTPVDIPATFTPLGQIIIAILIQIGALGVMTFTSFFALFFSGSTSIYSQLMLKDMVYSKTLSSLIPTLLYILGFTIAVEAIGAVLVFLTIHGTLSITIGQEIAFSAFHSLSAFCNAGFSILPDGMANPMLMNGNTSVYWVTSLLIISGSIGFPMLVNIRDVIGLRLKSLRHRLFHRDTTYIKPVHIYNMNTKIVSVTFAILFLIGALGFFFLEFNNSLAGMSLWEKITQAVFNSATPRSAGFSSVNPAGFMPVTLLLVMFLMWVGGASQSTGGGVKVNTLAAIWLNLRAILTGAPKVTAFRRTVSIGSVRRANAVVAISILSYLIFSLLVVGFDPDLPVRDLLFETLSALFTVGSSLGVTDRLSDASEITLSIAMFLGRVGLISLLSGLMRHRHVPGVTYPSDNIIIN